MLILSAGESIEIPFVYRSGHTYIDPDDDIYVFLKRGHNTPGPIILGPLKYNISLINSASPSLKQNLDSNTTLERLSTGSFVLKMILPVNLFEGMYTIQVSTTADELSDLREFNLQCKAPIQQPDQEYSVSDKSIQIGSRSLYVDMGYSETNTIILIGHTSAMEPYSIYRITSMQDGINALRADMESPLLRGLLDAYSCGARDIYIMSAGYMNEYQPDISKRNIKTYADSSATPNIYSFYELYYARLQKCYDIIKDYEFIDIIVPLETSIVSTENVNFVRQLADHCNSVQVVTGEVQLGVVGSRSVNSTDSDITELISKDFNLLSETTQDGFITKDTGKYILLVYGECIFNHKQVQKTYSSSSAAAFASVLASTRVDYGLAKKQIPSAFAAANGGLSSLQAKQLSDVKINSITPAHRTRKGTPYNVRISGDLTMSISENYADASNIRLVAMLIAEIQSMSFSSLGKFSHDKLIRSVDALLTSLKSGDIIRDYSFDAFADKLEKGKIYFNISLTSVRTLRSISFNVATGRGT